jgi:hypothetical protein
LVITLMILTTTILYKVVSEVDVCVIGGSCTGVFAAVRAARLGTRVALVEKQNCFGGTATAGLVNVWHSLYNVNGNRQIIGGLTSEIIERLDLSGGCIKKNCVNTAYQLDTELLKIELDRLILENTIQPYLHTLYSAPYLKNNQLCGIIIENKDGRQVILAKFFIDASGDGDLAYDLKLDHYVFENQQPPTPAFKLYGDVSQVNIARLLQEHGKAFGLPEDWGWGGPIPAMPKLSFRADTHVFGVDCSKADDLTHAEIEGRRQMLAIIQLLNQYTTQEGESYRIAAMCSSIGIRETRHFASDYRLNRNDLLYGVRFPDAIACGTYRVDIHHADNAGITFRYLDGREEIYKDRTSPPVCQMWRTDNCCADFYQIPFRTLVQRKISNLIMAGRMVDADPDAFGAVRVMVNLNQIGEAAGTAAYVAVSSAQAVWDIDPLRIRHLLQQGGSIIAEEGR